MSENTFIARNDINYLHNETGAFVEVFDAAVELRNQQFSIAWPPHEYPVSDDVLQAKKVLTEAEYHALTTAMKLFTHYEMMAGEKYWSQRIVNSFSPSCIKSMALEFSRTESCIHTIFYNEINKALGIDSIEFYNSYKIDPVLEERMKFVEDCIRSKDLALSTAVFSIVEGAVLYSQFAFLKHFRANGKNLMKNLVSGINASVRDENLHSIGGALLFNLECQYLGVPKTDYEEQVHQAAIKIYEHEELIIKDMFSKGTMKGITEKQLCKFVKSRIDICLENLGLSKIYKIKPSDNEIAKWFYDDINSLKLHDFFDVSGTDYTNKWTEEMFLRSTENYKLNYESFL